jgi:hypothetical protein
MDAHTENEDSRRAVSLIEAARQSDCPRLKLSGLHLAAVPDSLGSLTHLRSLWLDTNQLADIPDCIAQLPDLRYLNLSGNQITAIPDSLARIATLEHLDLCKNKITGIPESLSRLTNLRTLWLNSNQLTFIPDSLAELTNLLYLNLGENQITSIPSTFSQLINLQHLWLNNNRLTVIPNSLSRLLAGIRTISLEGNPLPEEIFAASRRGNMSLARYLLATETGKVHPRTTKLVLLGASLSGKTTLLEALMGNKHPCDPQRKETIGVNVVTIEALHPTDRQPMYLSAWDFAGQQIEHATHQFFLTEDAIYLVLWNARQGAESGKHDLWYWLELLKMRVRNPTFLLVATHVERTPPDLNFSDIQRSYGGCQGHYPVELENLVGLDSLRSKVLELAANSPSLRAEWPAEWLVVRNEIRKIRQHQPHLALAAFRRMMIEKGVKDELAQQDLAGQLHNLGEILCFQERDELSAVVILNAQWVTELIGVVVRSQEVRDNGGILSKATLAKLWKQAELEPSVQDYLVRLMDWFDLTYSTGDPTEMGIVVEALPYSTPNDLQQIEPPKDQARMEMIFRFPSLPRRLPPGVPTWSIARAHRFSTCKPWRDAAAFQDSDRKSQAIILASESKKEVRLRVAADYPPFFFGLLEGILQDTFKRYPGVVPERRLPCSCQAGCSATYLYETVLKRWHDGKPYVTCDQSGEDVRIDSLLSGARRPETEEGLHALHSDMRRLFTEQLRAQNEKMEKLCPSVFTLLPSNMVTPMTTWLESILREEELELTLYCEQDLGWHPTTHSVYRFTPDKEWLHLLKERWNQIVGVTKHVGPLVKAIGKGSRVPLVEAAGMVLETVPELSRDATGEISSRLGETKLPEFTDIETRELLNQLIDSLDSQRLVTEPKKGGLRACLIEDGRLLWLCPDHWKVYRGRQ